MGNQNESKAKYVAEYTLPAVVFVAMSIWLLYVHVQDLETTERTRQLWGSLYQIMAIYGGILGLFISRHWGGFKSLIGKAVLFLSISLLLQSFGQSVNSYYNFFHDWGTPYPSLGDLGFMGSTIFYILGVTFLARASGFKFSFKSLKGKFVAIIVPLALLVFSYHFFLQGYEFDWTNKIKIFLDFGYPLGDALYVSIALITFILSRKFLGGLMKKPVLLLACALTFQYLVDFMFLYQASKGTWYVGGMNDYLYFASYFVMTMALVYMGVKFHEIQES
jgi:hypothetical protein